VPIETMVDVERFAIFKNLVNFSQHLVSAFSSVELFSFPFSMSSFSQFGLTGFCCVTEFPSPFIVLSKFPKFSRLSISLMPFAFWLTEFWLLSVWLTVLLLPSILLLMFPQFVRLSVKLVLSFSVVIDDKSEFFSDNKI